MVERYSPVPAYRQIADAIRRQILSGQLGPGDRLPSEAALGHGYGVGRATVRAALRQLRAEGLLDGGRGSQSTVRELPRLKQRKLPSRTVVRLRMPTVAERETHSIPEGVPVADAVSPDGTVRLIIGDRDELLT